MAAFFDQKARMGRLETALGENELVLQRVEGSERVNGLYDFEVGCLAARADLDFDALLGTHATVTLVAHDGAERDFDGLVTEARWLGAGENGHRYRLRLRPWLWLAGLRRNQRIFHNRTVVELLEELFAPYASAGRLSVELSADYPELEYTVQYGETDLAFACRMMERHGISYHFRHARGSHEMVLTDTVEAHGAIGARPFRPVDGHHQEDVEHFWEWRPARRITTGAIRLTDYNFKTPVAAMETDRAGDAAFEHGQLESFDWPGDYLDQGRGQQVAELRLGAERGQDRRFEAVGDIPALAAGMRVTLEGDPVPGSGEEYLCLVATHSYTSDNYGSGGEGGDGYAYTGHYVLMPAEAPLLPELKTPRADVRGPQTATVAGEGEVDCDEYGRILVRFHWDLDEDLSMRCRVSQSWAGPGWGGMVIPRVGMEVVVEFLDGDPDKPLVTGCVYNGRNAPPAALPEHKSRSVFKTKSHEGEGFNELTFEDQAGEEFIYMHAQKNLDVHVENSAQRRVEFDDSVSVGNDSMLAVAANRTETVEGRMDVTVTGAVSEKTEAARGMDVAADLAVRAGGDLTLKAGGEIVIDASKITLVAGGAALTLEGGAVNAVPVLNVGSASPGAAAVPAIPEVLKAAAGEGTPFVSHCPLADA
ncbi:type VI secretion system Vgr family protein [Rhodovulum sulfidophilum]|uniref:type VI secretion system Vgr family protein n=1 Tax=Rhodovulum sulfidophilum TaxID=35806 RepID=UPI00138A01C3|nr:type VI secretion system tip protein TssI/VgrG [Rhodovulum sulfidophilum]NDK36212.1 type VI secretion system tip protein VgrG [Rhodovulum sulfidophilum]